MKKVLLAVVGSLFVVTGCGGADALVDSDDTFGADFGALSKEAQKQLNEAKAAHEKYKDVNVALADGYFAASPCENGLGFHYFHFDTFMAPPNRLRAADLMYYPDASSPTGLTLGGVQYFSVIFQDGQPFVGDSPNPLPAPRPESIQANPKLFGGEGVFIGPREGHFPGMPWHFYLKTWLFKPNPNGTFTPDNPKVDCVP